MIAFPTNMRIWIVAGVTDMRRGFTGLSAQVQMALEQEPLSGHVFFSWPSRRSHQGFVVRWRRTLFVSQTARTWTLHLAEGRGRRGLINSGSVVDVAGRDRLAQGGAHGGFAVGDLSS